jgi:outer membrane protein
MFRFTLLLLATLAAASAQVKIAVINVNNAILETAEIKKAQTDLTEKYKPRQSKIEELQKEITDLQAKLQGGKLAPGTEQDVQLTGQRKQRELQRLVDDLQADADKDRNEILQRAGGHMHDVVQKLATEKGYDVVIEMASTLAFKPTLEITKEAVVAYDKAYPVK